MIESIDGSIFNRWINNTSNEDLPRVIADSDEEDSSSDLRNSTVNNEESDSY